MEIGLNDYQVRARDHAVYDESVKNMLCSMAGPYREDLRWLLCLMYSTMGLAGEAGELANKVKKLVRDGALMAPDRTELHKAVNGLILELGDCLWYVSDVASCLNVPLSDVARANIEKLKARKAAGTLGGSGDHR